VARSPPQQPPQIQSDHQTTNLGGRDSNPFGRAIFPFGINPTSTYDGACSHSVPIRVTSSPSLEGQQSATRVRISLALPALAGWRPARLAPGRRRHRALRERLRGGRGGG